jgi:hypothetical protein
VKRLRELGELMNYNGYGRKVADLHVPPQELYAAIKPYADPLAFCEKSELLALLRQGFADDLQRARAVTPLRETPHGRIFSFPAEKWANRVAGVFSNEKARERPEAAHALLVTPPSWSACVRPSAAVPGPTACAAFFPRAAAGLRPPGSMPCPMGRLRIFSRNFSRCFLHEFFRVP